MNCWIPFEDFIAQGVVIEFGTGDLVHEAHALKDGNGPIVRRRNWKKKVRSAVRGKYFGDCLLRCVVSWYGEKKCAGHVC